MPDEVAIPASFRAMPRWWADGSGWLDDLPRLVAAQCRAFGVRPDGAATHGSNALVVPVRRGDQALALRLAPPTDDLAGAVAALRYWDGRGTVRLVDAEPAAGAMLLERLDAGRDLAVAPLDMAVPLVARILRATALRPPPRAPSTAAIVRRRVAAFAREWAALRVPADAALLGQILAAAGAISPPPYPTAVNGDLHYAQVLAGERAPWIVVDPLLLAGDLGYGVAQLLWTRLDEMPTAANIRHWFAVICGEAALDPATARRWVLFRAADYLLWGLRHGLTEDPVRCLRLLHTFAPPNGATD